MRKMTLRRITWLLAAFAGLALGHTAVALAQQPVSLEGTWKLAQPQTRLVPVDGRELPFTKEGRALYRENRALARKGDNSFDQTRAYCSAPGLPRLMLTPDRFRIFQRQGLVTMMFEWNRLFRQVDLRPNVPQQRPLVDSQNGVSFGHWEDDTLVIKSFGFLPGKLIDDYVPATETLEVTERIRLTDANTLEDRVTITDPQTFTRPWETVLTYKRQTDEPFAEDLCLDRLQAPQTEARR